MNFINLTDKTERRAYDEYELYRVAETGLGEWEVSRWNDPSRSYTVKADTETYDWTCNCPACQKSTGLPCKHIYIVRFHEAELANIEEREAEFEATEADRFFMMECQREVMADLAGAWA